MPFDNLPHADLAQRYGFVPMDHGQQQMFGSELRPIFDERGEPIPEHQRIVRTDTMQTLEVVGKSYTFIDNRTIFAAFEDAIAESGLDTRDLMVATDFGGPNLTRCFRQYVFPAHEVEIKPGVSTALRLLMWNSYDGTLKFSGRAGLFPGSARTRRSSARSSGTSRSSTRANCTRARPSRASSRRRRTMSRAAAGCRSGRALA